MIPSATLSLVFAYILLLGASIIQGITILDGPLTNTSFPSTKFSRWIGNFTTEDCDNTQAPVVTVDPEHDLCTLSTSSDNGTYYAGKIIFIESMLDPKKSYLSGCAFEDRYLQAELAGAVGVLDYRKRTVGATSPVHSNGHTPNQGSIPLVSVGKEFADIGEALTDRDPNVEGMLIQLSCSSTNLNDVWTYTITPIFNAVVGSYTTYMGIVALKEYVRLGRLGKAGQARNAGIRMRMEILLMEGIIMVVVGPLQALGMSGTLTHSIVFGDDLIGNQFKSLFEQQFVGVSFFTSYLLALFWLELRKSNKDMRPMDYAPANHKVSVVIIFILTVIPPLFFAAAKAFLYEDFSKSMETPIFFLLNIGVASFFAFQVRGAMRGLGALVASEDSNKKAKSVSSQKTANLMRHMGKWMNRFGFFVLLQALGLSVLMSLTSTPAGVFFFIASTGTTRIMQSVCKIRGMVVTDSKDRRASQYKSKTVADVTSNANRASITSSGASGSSAN